MHPQTFYILNARLGKARQNEREMNYSFISGLTHVNKNVKRKAERLTLQWFPVKWNRCGKDNVHDLEIHAP
jgi:hypothetical protein